MAFFKNTSFIGITCKPLKSISILSTLEEFDTKEIHKKLEAKTEEREKQLIEQFGSTEEYQKQCEFFAHQNCETFNSSTKNWTKFFEYSMDIMIKVVKSVKCFAEVTIDVTKSSKLFGLSKKLTTWLETMMGNAAASFIGNIATMGIWSGIKALYYIVKLGIRIHDFIEAKGKGEGNIFMLGRIISNAVEIVKSLVGARRKRRFSK